jgi:glycosyltransferase involved in cell wall biosynthesis
MHEILWNIQELKESKDFEDAANFLQKNFSLSKDSLTWSKEYFEWKLTKYNPAGCGVMLCAKVDERIIGTVTITKKNALNNGESIQIAEIGDTYTDLEFRKKGKCSHLLENEYLNKSVFGRLVHEAIIWATNNEIKLVYGTPNNNSYPGYLSRLGFEDTEFTVETGLKKIIIPTFRGLLTRIGIKINNKDKNPTYHINYIYKKRDNKFNIKKIIATKSEIDNLSTAIISNQGIEFIKDYRYWQYRYCENPIAKYEIRSIYLNHVLIGIFAYRIYRNEKGYKICCLMDTMCLPNLLETNEILELIKLGESRSIDFFLYLNSGLRYKKNIHEIVRDMSHISKRINNIKFKFNGFSLGNSDAA